MDYLEIANSPSMWLVCAPIVVLVLAIVMVFYKKTMQIAEKAGISREDCRKAFRTGIISAIGPSVAAFVVMLGLMTAVGAPMSWMRLSVIGNANAELLHAGLGADAIGQTIGSKNYDINGYAASVWGMSISWLIVLIFAPKATQIQNKFAQKDSHLLALVSISSMTGIMSYLTMQNVTAGWDMAVAAAAAAASMLLLGKTSSKLPWLKEYHLGIAMLLGMIAGSVTSQMFG